MAENDKADYQLMEMALHQAGRGVIGYRLCGDNLPLTIEQEPGILFSSARDISWRLVPSDEDGIVALYAGIAAQHLLNPQASEDEARLDYQAIDTILTRKLPIRTLLP